MKKTDICKAETYKTDMKDSIATLEKMLANCKKRASSDMEKWSKKSIDSLWLSAIADLLKGLSEEESDFEDAIFVLKKFNGKDIYGIKKEDSQDGQATLKAFLSVPKRSPSMGEPHDRIPKPGANSNINK